jgi:hypothetical protein
MRPTFDLLGKLAEQTRSLVLERGVFAHYPRGVRDALGAHPSYSDASVPPVPFFL